VRTEVVELLKCPECGAEGTFTVHTESYGAHEILTGSIECTACNTRFPVQDGYCDLLPHPSLQIIREQAAYAQLEQQYARESDAHRRLLQDPGALRAFMLNLPRGIPETEEHEPLVHYGFDQLRLTGHETVLDLGAGLGWTSAMFARCGCRCAAMDIAPINLSRTKVYSAEGLHFERLLADMTEMPLASGMFDIVFATAAVHHSSDLGRTTQEIARVLKNDGRVLLVNEPVIGLFEQRRKEEFGRDKRSEGINEHVYRINQWRRAFLEAGLKPQFEIAEVGFAEKICRRRSLPAYSRFPKRELLNMLGSARLRPLLMALCRPPALYLYPFNIVIRARKPAAP